MVAKSNSHIKDQVDSASDTLTITDPQGVIQYANKAKSKRTGFDIAEMIGKNPGNLWGGNMTHQFYLDMWNTIAYEKKALSINIVNKNKKGKTYEEQLEINPITDDQGDIKYYIETTRNLNSSIFLTIKAKAKKFPEFLSDVLIVPTKSLFVNRDSDTRLIQSAQKNPQKFGKIYTKYYEQIYVYFFERVGYDAQRAEDLAADTFFKALKYLPKFQTSNASYITYLRKIAHNVLVNNYKTVSRHPVCNIDDLELPFKSTNPSLELQELVQKANLLLSEIERSIVEMKYFECLSIHEIAILLNKSDNAVKLHLSRARKKLKEYIGQQ